MAEMIFPVPTVIKNLLNPVDLTDAATKTYVDTKTASVYRPPAGSNNYVQYKVGTAFAASANLIFNPTTKTLTVDYINADGGQLSNIANTSIVGKVASSLIADTITANAQPNITSVGTLTSLSVSGNLTVGGNVTVTGNLNYTDVQDLVVGDPLIYIGANNPGDVVDLGFVGKRTNPTGKYTGIVRDHTDGTWKLFDNVSSLPTTVVDFANASFASFKAGNATFGNVVSANYFSGSGNLLSNIQGSNVTGNVSHASHAYVADSANTVSGANVTGVVANATLAATATVAETVTTNAQPNITSVGILSSLAVSGNVSAGNIKTDHILYANGSPFIFNMSAVGSNTQVQFNDGGNFAGSSSLTFDKTTGTLSATAFTGDGSSVTNVDANTLNGHGTSYFATAVQGAKADTAVQPSALSAVATSGSYDDLSNKPILGTAAATNSTQYATAAQGSKADTALQLADLTGYATETYVDNAIANVPTTDLSTYATQTYVDNAISNIPTVDLSSYATESFVSNSIANLIDSAPAALDTLNELASALGNDANFAATLSTTIGAKLDSADFGTTADTWLSTKTTDNVVEGSKLYFTTDRANSAINNVVTKTFVDNLSVDATSLNGSNASSFATSAQGNLAESSIQPGDSISSLTNDAGYLVSSDIAGKLDTINFNSSADSWLGTKTTSHISEGNNLYYTEQRVNDAIDARVSQTFVNDLVITNVGTLSNLNVSGNVTADYFIGDVIGNIIGQFQVPGSNTDVLFNANGNASTSSAFRFNATSNTLSVNGEIQTHQITANFLAGDGSNVVGVLGNNIIGAVAVASSANLVTDSYQPNITAVGSLGNLTVLGVVDAGVGVETSNIFDVSGTLAVKTYLNGTSGDVGIGGNLTVGVNSNLATITAGHFIGNGSQLTGLYSNTEANSAIDARVTKSFIDNLNVDADTLDGLTSLDFATSAQGNLAESSIQPGNDISLLTNDAGYLVQTDLISYATQTYVNDSISNIPPVDFTGYATESFVGNAISNIPPVDFTGYATESYVGNAISQLVDSAPSTLNTLNELAAALGNDANYAATITSELGNKLDSSAFATTADTWAATYEGNLIPGNINITGFGNISGANYVVANYFIGDGSQLTGLPANYGNADVANYLPTHTGNISGGNIIATYFIGNGANLSGIKGSNVTGNVGNAVYAYSVDGANVTGAVATATTATTVTSAAQPNITSLGTLTTLQLSGMLTANNANFAGNVSFAGTVIGDGSGLSNVAAVTAATANSATTAGTVTTAAQPNITSVGTLTSVSISGNVTSNGYFLGNGSQLTGMYSNTNANGAIDARVTKSFIDNLSVSANTANSATTAGTVTTAAQPNITSVGTLTSLSVTGNLTAGNLIGNGSRLSNITGSNVTGNVGNAVHAFIADSANSVAGSNVTGQVANALVAGTVYTSSQPNITSVGTLTSLTVSGNLTANSITTSGTSGNISGVNYITANYFVGNGSQLTGLPSGVTSYNELTDKPTIPTNYFKGLQILEDVYEASGAQNIIFSSNDDSVSITRNYNNIDFSVSMPSLTGYATEDFVGNAIANLVDTAPAALNTLNELAAALGDDPDFATTIANTIGSKLATADFDSTANAWLGSNLYFTDTRANTAITNKVTKSFVDALGISANTSNTVITAAQPNITSLGTLTSLSVSGNVSVGGNITASGIINATAGLQSANIKDVDGYTAIIVSYGSRGDVGVHGNIVAGTSGNGNVSGNWLYGNTGSFTGNVSGNYFIGNGYTITNINGSNVSGAVETANTAATVTTAAQPNITSVGTLTSLTVSGTFNSTGNIVLKKFNETVVSAGNVSGNISPDVATGTIFKYTLTGNITFNGLSNATAGSSATIIITQDATGGRGMTSTMRFAGSSKTLSTAANAVDVISVFYDGTSYYASLGKGFA